MYEEYIEGCSCVNCRLTRIEKQIESLEKKVLNAFSLEAEK